MKTSVLMVCLGNICRSPLAEGILKSKVNPDLVFVDSAGTGAYHVGNLPDSRSILIAKKNQIDITDQKARAVSEEDLDTFDYIFAMDSANYRFLMDLAKNQGQKNKISRLMDLVSPDVAIDVPDPYYGGDQGFANVFEMIDQACEVLKKKLNQ